MWRMRYENIWRTTIQWFFSRIILLYLMRYSLAYLVPPRIFYLKLRILATVSGSSHIKVIRKSVLTEITVKHPGLITT
jgi:hypothetical protein